MKERQRDTFCKVFTFYSVNVYINTVGRMLGGLHTKGGSPRHNLQRCAIMQRSDSGDPDESYRVYGFVPPSSGVTHVQSTYGKLFQNLSLHMYTNYFPK